MANDTAKQGNGSSLTATVAFAALLLSIFSTIYILQYLPTLDDNTEFYVEEITAVRARLDRQETALKQISGLVSEMEAGHPYGALLEDLRNARNAIQSSEGELADESQDALAAIESMIEKLEDLGAKSKEELKSLLDAATEEVIAVEEEVEEFLGLDGGEGEDSAEEGGGLSSIFNGTMDEDAPADDDDTDAEEGATEEETTEEAAAEEAVTGEADGDSHGDDHGNSGH